MLRIFTVTENQKYDFYYFITTANKTDKIFNRLNETKLNMKNMRNSLEEQTEKPTEQNIGKNL